MERLPRHHIHLFPYPIIRVYDHLFVGIDAGNNLRAEAVALAYLHTTFDDFTLFDHEGGPAVTVAEQGAGGDLQDVVGVPEKVAARHTANTVPAPAASRLASAASTTMSGCKLNFR